VTGDTHDAPVAPPARRPPAARVLPERVFYGWWVVLACTVMMYVTVGVGYYGLAVFLRPLQKEHDWSNGIVSGATGLYFAVSGIAGLLAGPVIDRRGPKRFMAAGIVLTGAGATLVGFVHSVWQLYAVYALMAVAYGMGASVAVSSMLSKWFIHHRAKAMAVSSTGVSLGGATLVPLGTAMVGQGGLQLAAPVLGALVVAVALPTLLLVVATEPAVMGLSPDGHRRAATDHATEGADHRGSGRAARNRRRPPRAPRLSADTQYRVWTRPEAARTRAFWAVLVGFAMALATQTAVLIHQLSFLQDDDKLGSRGAAALAVTTTTIGSIVARLVVGMFADGWDKRRLAVLLFVMQGLAVFAYTQAHSTSSIYAVALVFGFTIGNVYMMQSLLVAELFGMMSFGAVMGVISLAGQMGSGAGLVFMGWLHDRSGGYSAPFHALAAVNLAGAVVVAFARHAPAKPEPSAAGSVDRGGSRPVVATG
jgi:MFS family permease